MISFYRTRVFVSIFAFIILFLDVRSRNVQAGFRFSVGTRKMVFLDICSADVTFGRTPLYRSQSTVPVGAVGINAI